MRRGQKSTGIKGKTYTERWLQFVGLQISKPIWSKWEDLYINRILNSKVVKQGDVIHIPINARS